MAELKHEDATIRRNGYFLRRYLGVGLNGRVVGCGEISERVERYQPGKLNVSIEVDRKFRKSAVWEALFERLERTARDRKARLLTAFASSRDGFSTSRLKGGGFQEVSSSIESRLDLRRITQARLEDAIAGFGDESIAFTTFAEEKDTNPEFSRDLYEMESEAGRDVPAPDRWRRMQLSEYADLVYNSPRTVEDAWVIAKHRGSYVGESFLQKGEGYPRFLTTGFTCVLRQFRGRGIAETLKLRTLLWAKKHGVIFVKTWNNSQNAPILGLNRKIGFRRYAIWRNFEKEV